MIHFDVWLSLVKSFESFNTARAHKAKSSMHPVFYSYIGENQWHPETKAVNILRTVSFIKLGYKHSEL